MTENLEMPSETEDRQRILLADDRYNTYASRGGNSAKMPGEILHEFF